MAVFDITSSYKQIWDFPTFNNLFALFINIKTKHKTIHILKKKDLKLYKIIILVEKFY